MNCPMCLALMEEKRVGEADFHLCRDCRGFWVQVGELVKLAQSLDSNDISQRAMPLPEESSEVQPDVRIVCPQCQQAMPKQEYAYDSGIMIDRCGDCGAIWLTVEQIFLIKRHLANSIPKPGEASGLLGKPWEASLFDDSSVAGMGAEILLEGVIALLGSLLD